MWNKMQIVPNPYHQMDKTERKAETQKIYSNLKRAHKAGVISQKPTLRKANTEFANLLSFRWWANDIYSASTEWWRGRVNISYKRHDRGTDIPWQHKQWIKNDILGDVWEAVELFPAESRLLNTANQYHLWGQPKFPFGFPARYATDETHDTKAKQTLQRRDNE